MAYEKLSFDIKVYRHSIQIDPKDQNRHGEGRSDPDNENAKKDLP